MIAALDGKEGVGILAKNIPTRVRPCQGMGSIHMGALRKAGAASPWAVIGSPACTSVSTAGSYG